MLRTTSTSQRRRGGDDEVKMRSDKQAAKGRMDRRDDGP